MTKPRIYLSSPHMGGEELNYIHDAFEKNWIAPLGDNVNGFEEDLQRYTGREHAAVVTSGTAAVHLALMLCGVETGDEVICQSFTFAATANPIRYQGATPVFIDSEPETWNMDPELLEAAIDDRMKNWKKPKAIVVVHLYGMPAKIERILEIGEKYDIPVIEDAAEALGSSIDGRRCGTFGKLSVLSFNGNKIITTSGGGALLSDDEKLIKKARFLATQARDDAPHYQHSELGYNYRMSNIVAGIGRGQMKVLEERVEARRANHYFYFEELNGEWLECGIQNSEFRIQNSSKSGIYFLKEPENYKSNRWLTTVLVNPKETGGVTREDIRQALEEQNIESRPLWKPMHLQPLYEDAPHYGNGVSDALFEYGLCLPSGSNMTDYDRERVVSAIKKILNR
ncbi:aminotransferase class I/II-fold pyridoxal phosphate-dependent enzyme [Balneolaceae bacterium YR4-1]|uniref:GDP-perosamine synthase n=1 Tax=Halalkalibaculum roseum TaxID=2709311 RepID=A0A6M1T3V1_9BACT|nr:aminotransferase class I/II-fold pyridoxal phosphate-dependent enzyme [Halalkalibaculum roseum]NGP76665.1 aminotransferase class I/II-fold pyridoxal phosphate-dependent enzyme [Halalkalibaculum roseum]